MSGIDRRIIKPTVVEPFRVPVEALQAAFDKHSPEMPVLRTCVACIHFNENNERCAKHGQQRPPARVIAYGCPDYENDNIPF